MKTRSIALLAAAALASLTACESPPYYGGVQVHDRGYDVRVVFSAQDRVILRDYYHGVRRLPPGLAKQGKLPPGHAYKMRRHQGVPPDVRWEYLPADLDRRLSRLPDGYVRIVIGGDVAILHTRTRVVLDVFEAYDD